MENKIMENEKLKVDNSPSSSLSLSKCEGVGCETARGSANLKTNSHSVLDTESPKNVPKLRFKEFGDEWVEDSIENLVNNKILYKPLDGNHGNIHPVSTDFVNYGIPFIMANDIKNGSIDLKNCKKIKKEQSDKLQKGFAYSGDILLTHKGSVGQSALVLNINTDYIMLTPQVTYYRVCNKEALYNIFLLQSFMSQSFQKMMKLYADGGTRPYIGITEQRSLKLNLPTLPEQQKIADCLSTWDDSIKNAKQIIEAKKLYKKGMMQKIFSQDIRFKDGDGADYPAWVEKKITDIAKTSIGLVTTMTTSYVDIGVPLIRNSDIKPNKINMNNLIYLDRAFDEINKTRRVNKNNIVTVHTGDIYNVPR